MAFKFFLVAEMILFSVHAQSKDIWLNFIGINTKDSAQNYAIFYDSSRAFEAACAKNKNVTCQNFTNLDPRHAKDPREKAQLSSMSENKSVNRGAVGRTEALEKIAEALRNVEPGSKIVISLEDHGGPVLKGKGKSCIALNESECISEADIADVLKKNPLPKNSKIGIIASACFSGGFHDLMSENVCVTTTADQHYSAITQESPWLRIASGQIKKFADIATELGSHNSAPQLKLFRNSQDVFNERACISMRIKLDDQKSKAFLSYIDKKTRESLIYIKAICKKEADADDFFTDISTTNKRMQEIALEAEKFELERKCKEDPALLPLCEVIRKINHSALAQKKIALELKAFKDYLPIQKEFQDLNKAALSMSRDEVEAGEYFFVLNANMKDVPVPKNLHKISKEKLASIKAMMERMTTLVNKRNEALGRLETELNSGTEIAKTGLDQQIEFFQKCFLGRGLNGKESLTLSETQLATINWWEEKARKIKKKVFTKEELEGAKKCEQSFIF